MNRTQVQYFLTVAKYLNFSEASRQLFVSQSAISKQIGLLETEFGVKLFDRTNKYVRLTAAGEILYGELSKFDKWITNIVDRAHAVNDGTTGTLNISVLHGIDLFSPDIAYLHDFSVANPGIKIDLNRLPYNKVEDDLYTGQSDLSIVFSFMLPENNFSTLELSQGIDVLAISKKIQFPDETHITADDFKDMTFNTISPDVSLKAHLNCLNIVREMGITPAKIRYTRTIEDMMLLVEGGLGYGLVSNATALYKRDTVRIVDLISDKPSAQPTFVVAAWEQESNNPAVPKYIEFVREMQGCV